MTHPVEAAYILSEEGLIGLVTCPICGCGLVVDPDSTTDVVAIHNAWHTRIQGLATAHIRQPSEPSYKDGEIVHVSARRVSGKIVDSWTEPGPLHCYTLRLDDHRLIDVIQDEVEPVHA